MSKFKTLLLLCIAMLAINKFSNAQVSVTASAGTAGPISYLTLKGAFDAINTGIHKGSILVSINGNTISRAVLIPILVQHNTLLRINSKNPAKVKWLVYDVQGRIVMNFEQQLLTGQNDLILQFDQLPAGAYYLAGYSKTEKPFMIRFYKN